jgi:hypothetical protein
MMQTTESRLYDHAATVGRRHPMTRSLFGQAEMSSILVVVTNVVLKQPLQMLLVYRDYLIKKIAPATLDSALRDAILPRALKFGWD